MYSLFSWFWHPTERPAHIKEGVRGEDIAAVFLRRLGYKILQRNVRLQKDEIDIIALDRTDNVLVFVEVKTRSRDDGNFHPTLNITHKKRSAMTRGARRYVRDTEWDGGYRLDCISVMEGKVVQHDCEIAWA